MYTCEEVADLQAENARLREAIATAKTMLSTFGDWSPSKNGPGCICDGQLCPIHDPLRVLRAALEGKDA